MLKNNIPQRKCIGCMKSKDRNLLIRMGYRDGHIHVDGDGKSLGRGFYICKDMNCYSLALKRKAFSRVAKTNINEEDIIVVKNYIEGIVNAGN